MRAVSRWLNNNHERLIVSNLHTNQGKTKKLFLFYHTQESLERVEEAVAGDVLSMKRLDFR